MRALMVFAVALGATIAAPAEAKKSPEEMKLVQGPSAREISSPYEPALQCLSSQLSDAQRQVTFSPGHFPDQTGRLNYVADSGVGSFSTQGVDSMLFSSLALTGVSLVDATPVFRQNVDWSIARIAGGASGPVSVPLRLPDVVISGAITTLDFLPGGGGEVNIAGVRLGSRESRILVGMDARAVIAARPNVGETEGVHGPAGAVLASTRIQKQIVGYDGSAGGAGFVGKSSSPLFLSVDLGRRQREAIQFAQRIMIDRIVYVLVADVFESTACDEHLRWGDELANLR